jgi:hypothetical protein
VNIIHVFPIGTIGKNLQRDFAAGATRRLDDPWRAHPCQPRWHSAGSRHAFYQTLLPGLADEKTRRKLQRVDSGGWAPSPLNWIASPPPKNEEKLAG